MTQGDGGGAGARHAPLLPMKFGCSSTLMLAAELVTVHHITSSPSSNACDSCSSPFFTPRYRVLLLGGIFSSAVMSSFRYLRHASHWLPLMGEGEFRVAAGVGVRKAAGAKRQRGGAAHA